MSDPNIIPRLQKLNMPPSDYYPYHQPVTIPEVTCDACGSFEKVHRFTVVIGVTESYALCDVCYRQVFRHRCAMCRQYAETVRIRVEDAYGCGYYERFCARCAADDNAMIERGKCELANARCNNERVTDLMSIDEALQRQREQRMKG